MKAYFILFFTFPILYLILEYWLDRTRIQKDLRTHQCQLVTLTRQYLPWPLRALTEKPQREYQVTYQDASGQVKEAVCHTEMIEGVYWTSGDSPKSRSAETPDIDANQLEAKNQALREKIQDKKVIHQQHKSQLQTEIQQLESQLNRLRS